MEKKDHNLVLGLIWVLILAYQHIKKDDQVKWLQSRLSNIPGINITDLSSSFQDGMAFAHLIHSFKPEAIDLDEISQFKIPDRLETSFSKAEQHLGIPRLLEPSDCYPDRPSEQSIMTYLSFFHNVSRQEEGEVFFDTVTPPVTPSKPESTTTPQTTPSKVDAATATLDQKKLDFGDSDALKSEIETLRRENSYLKDAQIPELRFANNVDMSFLPILTSFNVNFIAQRWILSAPSWRKQKSNCLPANSITQISKPKLKN